MPLQPIYVKATTNTIPAGAVYASPTGQSGNAGTAASPKDLLSAYAATPANGTLVLQGTLDKPYREYLNITKKITIIPAPNAEPVISGAVIVPNSSFILESGNIYYRDGLVPTVAPLVNDSAVDPARPFVDNLQQVFINGVALKQVGSKAALVDNSFFINGTRLYVKASIAGKVIEVSNEKQVINIASSANGTRITGIAVVKGCEYGILINCPNVVLTKVTAFYNAYRGIFVQSGSGCKLNDVDALYNGSTGVHVGTNTPDFVYDGGNLIGNNFVGFAGYWGAAGIKVAGQTKGYPFTDFGLREIKNVTFDNAGGYPSHGLWLDINVFNFRVHKNIAIGGLAGVIVEACHGNYVVNNLLIGNSNGVLLQNTKRNVVANNTLVLNNRALVVRGTGRLNADAEQRAAGYDWATEANQFYNNIVDRTPSSSLLIEMVLKTNSSTQAMSVMKNNAYNRESATKPANILNWRNSAGAYSSYDSLTEFRADYPSYESGSIGRTGVTTATSHPFFEAGTMTVKAGSPTIGTGSTVSGVVADILGVADNTKVSMGSTLSLGTPTTPEEPPAACSVEIADATAPLFAQINQLNDDLNAANIRIAELEAQQP